MPPQCGHSKHSGVRPILSDDLEVQVLGVPEPFAMLQYQLFAGFAPHALVQTFVFVLRARSAAYSMSSPALRTLFANVFRRFSTPFPPRTHAQQCRALH